VKINEYIKSIFKAPKATTKAVEQRALQFFKQTITANNIGDLSVTQMLSNYSFICMNKIAELVANQKYYVGSYDAEYDTYETISEENNWLVNIVDNNSQTMQISFNELLELVTYWYYIEGNVYLWFRVSNYNGGTKAKYPVEIILLPSREVEINAGSYNLIDSYSLTLNNKWITIPATEVCHIKTMSIPTYSDNPTYFYKGISKYYNALKDVLGAYYTMLDNANTELNRQGVPNIVLTNDHDPISPQEQINWQDALNQRYGKYAPIVFAGEQNTKYERMDIGNNIIAQNTGAFAGGLNTELKQLITSMYGLMLDFVNGTPAYTSNYKEMKATIYEQTIDPLTNRFLSAINKHLKQYDNGEYSIQYTPFKYESLTDKISIANTLMLGEAISKNELRELFGYEVEDEYDNEIELEPEAEAPEMETEIETENEIDELDEADDETKKLKSLIETEISKSIKKKVLS
jgi:hypothetical protein